LERRDANPGRVTAVFPTLDTRLDARQFGGLRRRADEAVVVAVVVVAQVVFEVAVDLAAGVKPPLALEFPVLRGLETDHVRESVAFLVGEAHDGAVRWGTVVCCGLFTSRGASVSLDDTAAGACSDALVAAQTAREGRTRLPEGAE
jgi:hypothetical protein